MANSFQISTQALSNLAQKRVDNSRARTVSQSQNIRSIDPLPSKHSQFSSILKRLITTIRTVFRARKVGTIHTKSTQSSSAAQSLPKVVIYQSKVVGVKLSGVFQSIESIRKAPQTPELKALISALDAGDTQRFKGDQQKIGSKLYVDNGQIRVNRSFFSSERVQIGEFLDLDHEVAQLKSNAHELTESVHMKDLTDIRGRLNELADIHIDGHIERSLHHIRLVVADKVKHSIVSDLESLTYDSGGYHVFTHHIQPRLSFFDSLIQDDQSANSNDISALKATIDESISHRKEELETMQIIADVSHSLTESFDTAKRIVGPQLKELEVIQSRYHESRESIQSLSDLRLFLEENGPLIKDSLNALTTTFHEVQQLQKTIGSIVDAGYALVAKSPGERQPHYDSQIAAISKSIQPESSDISLKKKHAHLTDALPIISRDIHEIGLDVLNGRLADMKVHHDQTFGQVAIKREDRLFKEGYIDFQKKYAERFKTVKSSLLNKTGYQVAALFGEKSMFDGISLTSDLAALKRDIATNFTKDTLNPYVNDLQDLYLEKRYGLSMQTRVGKQYQAKLNLRTPQAIDHDIISKLKDMIQQSPQSTALNSDRLAHQIKVDYLDSGYGEPLQLMQATIDRDVDDFFSLVEQKDSYYSGMREYNEVAQGLEQVKDALASHTHKSSQIDDINNVSALVDIVQSFQTFGDAYLTGHKEDILFGHDEIGKILEDTLNEASSIGMYKGPATIEMKDAFIEYTLERLKGNDLLINGGQFNFEKTQEDVAQFRFRTKATSSPIQNTKGKIFMERLDKDIYRHNFASSSTQMEGGPQFFKSIDRLFDQKLKLALRSASQKTGEIGRNVKMMRALHAKKTRGEQLSIASKIKLDAWRIRFLRATGSEKLNMLSDAKSTVDSLKKAGTDTGKSSVQTSIEDKTGLKDAQDLLSQAQDGVATVDDVSQQIAELDGAINDAVDGMSSVANNVMDAKDRVTQLLGYDTAPKSVSISGHETLAKDLSQGITDVNDALRQGVQAVADHLNLAESMIGTVTDQLASQVPYYNQAEAAIGILYNLGQAARAQHQIDGLRERVESGMSLAQFGTAHAVENDPEFQLQLQSFTQLISSKSDRDDRLNQLVYNVLNLLSPPGTKVGNFAKKIYSLMSADKLDGDELKQIIKDALVINADFASFSSQRFSDQYSGMTGYDATEVLFNQLNASVSDRDQANHAFKAMGDMHVKASELSAVVMAHLPSPVSSL